MKALTILITGSTSGIGRHAALHLARLGHRVFATGRNDAALAQLKAEAPSTLETIRLDVTSAASIEEARSRVDELTNIRGVDVLVNNAGYGMLGPTEMISDGEMRAQYETNVFGLMNVTRAFLPAMHARGSGRIVNVSSIGGLITLPLFGVYNSTKYAVESLSDAMRLELAPFGIQVSLIEPGVIDTGFTDRSMQEIERFRAADSRYAPVLARTEEMRKSSDRLAVSPKCISKAIEHASTASRPHARYVAPLRAAIMVAIAKWIPTRWRDALLRLMTGFSRARFAAAKATPRLDASTPAVEDV
jgi:short-subunit dehydrogenase